MNNYFNVLDYGVKQNCHDLQTSAFQRTIDECFDHGGGIVVVPSGTYYLGSIRLYSNMTLLLEEDAKLLGSKNYQDYQDFHVSSTLGYLNDEHYIKLWNLPKYYIYGIVCAFEAENISIIGQAGSLIDGQDCFDENGEEKFRGPMGIIFSQCKNITLQGYTFSNSANWSHQLDSCINVSIDNVKIKAGHDGFNLHHCKDIHISNCHLETGDDCIAGYDIKNLLVEHCYLNTACNALRIGGSNLIFDHCKFIGPGHYPHRSTDTYHYHAVFKYYAIGCDVTCNDGMIMIKNSELNEVTKLLVYDHGNQEMMQDNLPLRQITFDHVNLSGLNQKSVFKGNGAAATLIFNNVEIDYDGNDEFLEIDDNIELNLKNVTGLKPIKIKAGPKSIIEMSNCKNIEIVKGDRS